MVEEDWNALADLLEIEPSNEVYGWSGGFKGMARSGGGATKRDSAKEGAHGSRLPSGGTQFYIPNLKFSDVARYSIIPL